MTATNRAALAAVLVMLACGGAVPSPFEAPPRAWREDPWKRKRKHRELKAPEPRGRKVARRKRERRARRRG